MDTSKLPFLSNIQTLLNNLEVVFPHLLHPHALKFYEEPAALDDFHVVILHNNSPYFLDAYFRHIFQISFTRDATTSVSGNDELPYRYSDKHIELSLTEEHVQYIKQVTKNRTLSDKKSIFYIKNIPPNSQHLQNQLKNVIERSGNAIFVIQAETQASISYSLRSMALSIPLHFTFDRVNDYYQNNYEMFEHTSAMNIDQVQHLYQNSYGDSMAAFLRIAHRLDKTSLEKTMDAFVEACDSDHDPLSTITRCRELAYKLFHMNYPLANVAKYLLSILPSHILTDFTIMSANADHLCMTTKKDILTYERFLIDLSDLIKTPSPPKKVLKKVVKKKCSEVS